MTCEAKVILDSISPEGRRLTTLQLRYPRFVHAEFMTHRQFSRNASSSRAIPIERLIADVMNDPVMPLVWGSNRSGMQAGEELTDWRREEAEVEWRGALDAAVEGARRLKIIGLHKQLVNRLLEPFSHINVVVTATEWANFFTLRRHPDAQPEIKALADAMWAAREASAPRLLRPGQWHLPYVENGTEEDIGLSVARCARVSYLTHDGRQATAQEDMNLFQRLMRASPPHASPAEHQATPDTWRTYATGKDRQGNAGFWFCSQQHGNFVGWRQYRKTLPGECATSYPEA